jgi:hypothetical protein
MGADAETQQAILDRLREGSHVLALAGDTDLIWQGA